MPVLSTDDVDLHYELVGDGPPLMLIAGLASDSASWGPVSSALSKEFTLIMPDNRGAGRTKNKTKITIEAMAHDCAALLDHLSIPKAHILGHSMGGVIAMSLCASAPEKTGKLILAASSSQKSARTTSVINTLVALRESGVADEHWLRAFFHWLFEPAFFENKNAVDAAIALAIAYPYRQSVEHMRQQLDALQTFDASSLPARIKAPALILAGEQDLMFSPATIEKDLSGIAGKRFEILPGAAHSLHWDKPAAFAAAVTGFLKAKDQAAD